MADQDPGWDLYRSFLAVMSEGSLSAAARNVGMTQPSLGRHMRELETKLGIALFVRSPQGLTPTELAHDLLPHAQAMAAATSAFRRGAAIQDDTATGVVRVTASEVIGIEVLPPMLTAFRKQQPGVVIELALSNQVQDLLRRDADIAVRMLRPTQQALVARPIGQIELGLHAHRRYLRAHGEPRSLDDLAHHTLIGYDHGTPYIRKLSPANVPYSREHFALRTDNDLAHLAMLRAGYGIGICQCALAARDPALVRLLPKALSLNMDTWLVMHEDQRRNRATRLLYQHLATGLIEYAAGKASKAKRA